MKPIAYTMEHVDTDLHAPFRLKRLAARGAPIVPAPIISVSNTVRVNHSRIYYPKRERGAESIVLVDAHPEYPRVIVREDWT